MKDRSADSKRLREDKYPGTRQTRESAAHNDDADNGVELRCHDLLSVALHRAARSRGDTGRDMARWFADFGDDAANLAAGRTDARHVSQGFIEACARYLALPPVVVKCLAGQLVLRDFVVPRDTQVPGIAAALARIAHTSILSCLVPGNALDLDDDVRRFVLRCAEEASGQALLEPPFHLHEMRMAMQAAMSVEEFQGRVEQTRVSTRPSA